MALKKQNGNEVPNIIRKDIYTINPQGHEPYLRF